MSNPQKTSSTSGWYYGWTIVFAAALLTMITVGMRMSIGPFVIPMSEGLGMSRSMLSAVIAIGMLIYGFGMPIAGVSVNRYGTRATLMIGAVMVVLSILGTIYTTNLWIFALKALARFFLSSPPGIKASPSVNFSSSVRPVSISGPLYQIRAPCSTRG